MDLPFELPSSNGYDAEAQGSRMRKRQPPKEQGRTLDATAFINLDGENPYEVTDQMIRDGAHGEGS